MTPTLECRNLGRHDAGRWRVRDLEFSLSRGSATGMLGPNGAGKSTALALIAGALAPSRGEIRLNGHPIDRQRRGAIGYLPQSPALYPELSVAENLAFWARVRGLRPQRVRSCQARVMEQCGITAQRDRLAGLLSRGQAQRVALARALLGQPEVLILDEPSSALDPLQARDFRNLLLTLRSDHAILLASHHSDDLSGICNRLILLEDGRQRQLLELDSDITVAQARFGRLPADQGALRRFPWIDSWQPLPDGWLALRTTAAPADAAQQLAALQWELQAYVPASLDLATLLQGDRRGKR
jgi:ABC-2 type transport system ATP-binding protein